MISEPAAPFPKGGYGMDNEWNNNEYLPPQPEHSIDPEYTPEYPDVTFFKESAVTMREENIFQGEVPVGESTRNARAQKQRKRSRYNWFRKFLGSAMRGGAAIVAAAALIGNAAAGNDSSGGRRVRAMLYEYEQDAFEQPDDYTPDELAALWNSDPQAPHRYDYDHLIVVKEASCTENGLSCYICTECGVRLDQVTTKPHEPAPPVEENRIEPDCTHDGSYEEVTFCKVCGTEMTRIHRVLYAPGHTAGEFVVENAVPPSCTENGSEDDVVYCTVCGEEISRTTVTVAALGHEAGEPVAENVTEPGCTEEGSEEEVVYCAVCGEEISRTTVVLEALGHTEGEPVTENVTEPGCTKGGSQDEVVYCEVCGEEISRTTETTPALGHSYTAQVTAPTCTAQGYTTHTCSRCGSSYKDTYTAALGHHFDIQTWNWTGFNDEVNNPPPVVTCTHGCGTPAFTVSFVNATTLNYTINSDFWKQADAALGYFEWGDCVAYQTSDHMDAVGYIADGYNEATSPTGRIVLDFTPESGRTYYYKICLRVATSTSSDDVFFVAPQGGANKSYTAK